MHTIVAVVDLAVGIFSRYSQEKKGRIINIKLDANSASAVVKLALLQQ